MLIFELAVILVATKIAGDLSVRLGQPSVLGKLLIGIVLGPTLLGFITNTEVLKEISEIGVILLMFIAGMETDLDEFKKAGLASLLSGTGGVILPFGAGFLLGHYVYEMTIYQALFLGSLLTATSVSISVQTIRELGKLKSREGVTILGAAVLDDIIGILVLAFVIGMAGGGETSIAMLLAKKVIFFVLAILIGIKIIPWALKKAAPLKVTEATFTTALVICFLYAYFANIAGLAPIIGAYLAGILISLTDFEDEIIKKVETVSYSIFVPVFFTSIGVAAEIKGLGNYIGFTIIVTITAVVTKIIGSGLGAKISGMSWRSSLGIGAGMVSRGEVALIIAALGLEKKLLEPPLFTVMVVMVLFTTIVTPPLLKVIFRDKQKQIYS